MIKTPLGNKPAGIAERNFSHTTTEKDTAQSLVSIGIKKKREKLSTKNRSNKKAAPYVRNYSNQEEKIWFFAQTPVGKKIIEKEKALREDVSQI